MAIRVYPMDVASTPGSFTRLTKPSTSAVMELISTQILSASAASITFSNLSSFSQYRHLEIRMASRLDSAVGYASLFILVNGDTGANYSSNQFYGNGSGTGTGGGTSATNGAAPWQPDAGRTTGVFGAGIISITDFNSTVKYKTLRAHGGTAVDVMGGFSSTWLNTASITSVQLKPSNSSNFIAGSRFSIYGVK